MRKTILFELSGTAPSTDDYTIKSEYIKNARIVCIQRMAATDETTDTKAVSFGIKAGKSINWLQTVLLTTKAYYYALTETVYAKGDIQLLMKFHSPTSGDVLRGFVFGYYETE
jgi:hypothetical protein